jgi:hypothetical protein
MGRGHWAVLGGHSGRYESIMGLYDYGSMRKIVLMLLA